jgi:hypothetical protein
MHLGAPSRARRIGAHRYVCLDVLVPREEDDPYGVRWGVEDEDPYGLRFDDDDEP